MNADGRQANIELIRILSMIGIIIMHCLNPKIGGMLDMLQKNGSRTTLAVTYFIVSVFACAVNLFILIMGYFMCKSYTRGIFKPLKLILQVIVFQAIPSIMGMILGFHDLTIVRLIKIFIPANYYVILYVALYWISPYINLMINSLDIKQLKKCVLTMFLLFSVWPTIVDAVGEFSGGGHNYWIKYNRNVWKPVGILDCEFLFVVFDRWIPQKNCK